MATTRRMLETVCLLAALGCGSDVGDSPTEPGGSQSRLPSGIATAGGKFVHSASGGYHFLIPENFNGGIFGRAVDNRLTFHARREADGTVTGSFNYEQTDFGTAGIPPVTRSIPARSTARA